jgi:acetone monooxygenase (methyl acetate-forming)
MATVIEAAASSLATDSEFDAVVVGAGFAGLYQLYCLRQAGLRVRLFEAGEGVGGVWYWNRYPGARVDAQSYIYQYFFSDELLAEWDWHEQFPGQPDLEAYLNFAADRLDLKRDIQFSTRVASAHYDEESKRWTITTESGEQVRCQFFAMCTGGLSAPLLPPFKGYADFTGETLYTAFWPRESPDLAGKRVAVIGTGASGVQVIQSLAGKVAELTVFQRTPPYTLPMQNPRFDDAHRADLRRLYPSLKKYLHSTFTGFDMEFLPQEYAALSNDERMELLEMLWSDGTMKFWIAGFSEIFFDAAINEEVSNFVRNKLRERIGDPELAAKLVPTNYGFGLRRVPLESTYYEAYTQHGTRLVDLRDEPIEHFTAQGLKTTAREYQFDVLILATGFDAGTGALTRVDIRGRGGVQLKESWERDGVSTTFGLQVHGFPNMFMTMAPFSPASAFCNVPICVQQQVGWISDCIAYVRANSAQSIEPTAEEEARWVAHHDEVANTTLIAQVDSWYNGGNVAGKKKRTLVYLGGVGAYAQLCADKKASNYEGFAIT